MNLDDKIESKYKKQLRGLKELEIETVNDLLFHLPFRYEDKTELTLIKDLPSKENQKVSVTGYLTNIIYRKTAKKGITIIEAYLADKTTGERVRELKLTWFNQPWIIKSFKKGDNILVYGTYKNKQLIVNESSKALKTSDTLSPIYPANDFISSKQIENLVKNYKKYIDLIQENLPADLLVKHNLMSKKQSLENLHFPKSVAEAKKAKNRIIFEEFLIWQLHLHQKKIIRKNNQTIKFKKETNFINDWEKTLPFKFTVDQKKAINDMNKDLISESAMNRLLMGDVGSGKTVLATYAMLRSFENNYQSCILAPTETLAEQHYETFKKFIPAEVNFALLTSSVKNKRKEEIYSQLANGGIDIIIGTHALLEDKVKFKNLGLVVIDEQHRFGVKQRAKLDSKSEILPHIIHMTATPIPRSLALASWNDMDMTIVKTKPQDRKDILTQIAVTKNQKIKAIELMKEQVSKGFQGFIVCPLIEESETLEIQAAIKTYEDMTKLYPEIKFDLIHGKMKSDEKKLVMQKMQDKEVDVLIATTVIEVGIDIPNATFVFILEADRYGISQLHQIRGRVGRNDKDSYCFLIAKKATARMQALEKHNNGFELSEIDLQLRGQGDLMGTKQHGETGFKYANLAKDYEILKKASVAADNIVKVDLYLEDTKNQYLSESLMKLWENLEGTLKTE